MALEKLALIACAAALLLTLCDAGRVPLRFVGKTGRGNSRRNIPPDVRTAAHLAGLKLASVYGNYTCTLIADLSAAGGDKNTEGKVILVVFNSGEGYNVAVLASFNNVEASPPDAAGIFATNDSLAISADIGKISFTNTTKALNEAAYVLIKKFPFLAGLFPDVYSYAGGRMWSNTDGMALPSGSGGTYTDLVNDIWAKPKSFYCRLAAGNNAAQGTFSVR